MNRKILLLAATVFMTSLLFAQERLHETFENLNQYDIPEGWIIHEAGGAYGYEMGRTVEGTVGGQAVELPCLYYGQWYDEVPAWIITPQLRVTSEDDSLTFLLKIEDMEGTGDVTDVFNVLISTDNNEKESFNADHPLLTVEYDEAEELVRYAVSLKAYLNQSIYIAFQIVPGFGLVDYSLAEVSGPQLYTASCDAPQNLFVSDIDTVSAVLSWSAVSGVSSYTLQLLPEIYNDWSEVGLITNVTDTFYKFENLSPAVSYKVRVRSDCGSSQSEFSSTERFVTINNVVVSVPYFMDFEQEDIKDYAFFTTNDYNKWYIAQADGCGADSVKHSMYVSSDNGMTLSYTDGLTAAYSVLRIQFPDDSLFKLSYNYKVRGIGQSWNGGQDFFCVYMLEDSVKIEADHNTNVMQSNAKRIQGNTYSTSIDTIGWTSKEAVLDSVSGKTMQLVFMWKSDANGNWPPAVAIDNVKIETYTPCADVDSTIEAVFCENSYYYFYEHVYNTEGTYHVSIPNSDGCDTNFTLILTQQTANSTEIFDTISSGMVYKFGDIDLTESGIYIDTFKNQYACDSVVTLNLYVKECVAVINEQTALGCQGDTLLYNGEEITEAGTYTFNFKTEDGCDSIVNLVYTLYPVYDTVIEASIDEGDTYTENGFNETQEGTYIQRLKTTETGCDSIVTLILTYNPYDPCKYPSFDTVEVTICDNEYYVFADKSLNKAGSYTEIFKRSDGCDSTVTLILTVNPTYTISFSVTIDKGSRYTENGFDVDTEGEHILNLKSEDGCDSTVILTLRYNNALTDVQQEELISLYPNPAKDKVTIKGNGAITIFDNEGKIVYNSYTDAGNIKINDGIAETEIDVSKFIAGIYYVRIGEKTIKLLIE